MLRYMDGTVSRQTKRMGSTDSLENKEGSLDLISVLMILRTFIISAEVFLKFPISLCPTLLRTNLNVLGYKYN